MRAGGRLVAAVGARRMAAGVVEGWQTIADPVRAGSNGRLEVRFDCAPARKGAARFAIACAELWPVGLPAAPDRTLCTQTSLVAGGRPAAYIVYPAAPEAYRGLAGRVQAAVRRRCGVELPLADDRAATQPDRPVLKSPYRDAHLIVLGRLGRNRAAAAAYNRFLCAADGDYPGDEGYEIRTAANVLRNRRNHVIVASSSDAGMGAAVDRFLELLAAADCVAGRSLVLPWLLDVKLGGDCRQAFERYDRLWREHPNSPDLPRFEPGYQTVVRWYANAMAYYWSGWPGFRARTLEHLGRVLHDRAATHHYIVEFLVRAWDMLDDGDLVAPAQRRAMDGLILKNFWEFLTGPDLGWMTTFSPPYDKIRLTNRHSIAPWMADLAMADFLADYFPLCGELAEVVAYRRAEKHPFFEHLVAERWQPSLPRPEAGGHHEEIVASLFRYALHHERYDFFTRGNAHRALRVEQFTPERGRRQDDHLLLGMLAHVVGDGRYAALLALSAPPEWLFQHRYLCGVHRYRPGGELGPVSPSDWAGVRAPPLMPHDLATYGQCRFATHRPPQVDPERLIEGVSFRSGFDAADDHLLVSCFGPKAGVVTRLAAGGRLLLSGSAAQFEDAKGYLGQNAVSVLRTDRWVDDNQPYAGAARREWLAESGPVRGAAFTLEPFMTASLRREILWLRPGLYLVRDTIRAQEQGDYSIRIAWRPQGSPAWNGNTWAASLPGVCLRLTPLGDGFRVLENVGDVLAGRSRKLRFQHAADCRLDAGQAVTAMMLLQAGPQGQSACRPRLLAPDRLLLDGAGPRGESLAICWKRPGQAPEVCVAGRTTTEPAGSAPGAARAADRGLKVVDSPNAWHEVWSYGGLERPGLVERQSAPGDMVDLGPHCRLAEVRAARESGAWRPARLPQRLDYAPDQPDGKPPPPDSPAWKPLPPPGWRASVETRNYGGAIPRDEGYQAIGPLDLEARWIRGAGAGRLAYYDRARRRAGAPLRLEVADLDADGSDEILAASAATPPFLRDRVREDTSFALLRADGTELLKHTPVQSLQAVRLLPVGPGGRPQVAALGSNARLDLFALDGTRRPIDLYAMHQQFNAECGRPNTRAPAGGLTLPFAVGSWRPRADGRRKLLVARYGAFSFLDAEDRFEGVLHAGSYVQPAMLAEGIDFDGDGRDEQLCVGRYALTHLDGSPAPRVTDPGGALFYPQVYQARTIPLPGTAGATVDGPPVHLFAVLPFGSAARFVLCVREPSVSIYDGRERKWVFQWVPVTAIRAAAVEQAGPRGFRLWLATDADLVWRLEWSGNLDRPGSVRAWSLRAPLSGLWGDPHGVRPLLAACQDGLYLLEAGSLSRVAAGAFQAAAWLSPPSAQSVVAVTPDGQVARFSRAAP